MCTEESSLPHPAGQATFRLPASHCRRPVWTVLALLQLAASASIVVGAAKLVATLTAVLTVDRFGRRPLLFVGTSMMLLALVALGTTFAIGTPSDPSDTASALSLPPCWPAIVVIALVLYVCGYQASIKPNRTTVAAAAAASSDKRPSERGRRLH